MVWGFVTMQVSRCGMVYLDGREVGWEPLIGQWMAQLPVNLAPYRNKFNSMFHVRAHSVLEGKR